MMKTSVDVEQLETSLEAANRRAVVEELARQFWEVEGRRAVVNLPNDPVEAVRIVGLDHFPHFIIRSDHDDEGGSQVETVCIVATSDEVNASAAVAWKVLAGSGLSFYLFVPRHMVPTMRRLCAEEGINVSFWGQWWMEGGTLCIE
jgi:hypothetical protein